MARRSDGQVVAWGSNIVGECSVPALPAGVTYVEVAAGGPGGAFWSPRGHTVARRSDGSVVAWGDNSWGQCSVPALPAGATYVEIAAGADHTVACYEPACPTSTTYCTAKTNSLGCTPTIEVVGIPSASFGNGCTVSTTNVIGQKYGIYIHSTSGPQAQPFHGGFLCLQSPLRRHPVRNSGGTATLCDGVLSEDLNAYIASGADPSLVAGASVWLQAWSRDPAAPFGDSLSDALSAVICP